MLECTLYWCLARDPPACRGEREDCRGLTEFQTSDSEESDSLPLGPVSESYFHERPLVEECHERISILSASYSVSVKSPNATYSRKAASSFAVHFILSSMVSPF